MVSVLNLKFEFSSNSTFALDRYPSFLTPSSIAIFKLVLSIVDVVSNDSLPFKKYALNIISQSFISEEKRNRFIDLYRSGKTEEYHNKLKKLFYHYFKNVGIIHPSKLDIKNNFPDCPFILFLRNINPYYLSY